MYTLIRGLHIAFNQIYTDSCAVKSSSVYSDRMLIINFCIHGRCEATLSGNKYAIVKENEICISTILPTKDFYYPGSIYEGIQLYLDLSDSNLSDHNRFLSFLGIDLNRLSDMFCKNTGLYIHQMSDDLSFLVKNIWETKETEAENIITSDLSKKYTVPCLTALYNLL